MAIIHLPDTLLGFTSRTKRLTIQASTLGEALIELIGKYPNLRGHLFDENLRLRGYVNIYLDQQAMKLPEDFNTPLPPTAVIRILQNVAGG